MVRVRWDHPRSRGVYSGPCGAPLGAWGSSPLARGLRSGGGSPDPDARIIPARAGFTRPVHDQGPVPADHPRSRGVYATAPDGSRRGRGSSPLARGLLPTLPQRRPRRRIIPARAGFTGRKLASIAKGTDHPRSRGVYTCMLLFLSPVTGSSPLARGLLVAGARHHIPNRIIPARAGFTLPRSSSADPGWDHPRSRGVYRSNPSIPPQHNGSSPLARGLQEAGQARPLGGRIIPARAGFTASYSVRFAATSDHPRSRGVYGSLRALAAERGRIIPARAGFTAPGIVCIPRPRIIPARAGFTISSILPVVSEMDHPRSRGVYVFNAAYRHGVAGSSPLARGLRLQRRVQARSRRIIPARAGFTHRRFRVVGYRPGSSPLARGLLLPSPM